jgi:hypothetical protein
MLPAFLRERKTLYGNYAPFEYSHTLEDQIMDQIKVGFEIIGFYEDYCSDSPIKDFIPSCLATRALKPDRHSIFSWWSNH